MRTAPRLHPMGEPFDSRMFDRGDGHSLYVEQYGHPQGRPVIVLHGGPGGGCSPFMRRFFDPSHYRAILFDQRGCGRSTPRACVAHNTTADLVGDIAAMQAALDLGPAILFGGSWGATLALAYAQRHPAAVSGLVLRGVFLGRQCELDWFYGGGAGRFFPDLWAQFCAPIPVEERGDMIAAYHRRLFCGDTATEIAFSHTWQAWENALATIQGQGGGTLRDDYARTFARLECHYFANHCFLAEGQLLRDRALIEHLPAEIVQGRYDMVCPPIGSYELAEGWTKARLHLIGLSGHALSEPAITTTLVQIMDQWREAG